MLAQQLRRWRSCYIVYITRKACTCSAWNRANRSIHSLNITFPSHGSILKSCYWHCNPSWMLLLGSFYFWRCKRTPPSIIVPTLSTQKQQAAHEGQIHFSAAHPERRSFLLSAWNIWHSSMCMWHQFHHGMTPLFQRLQQILKHYSPSSISVYNIAGIALQLNHWIQMINILF